MVHNNWGNKLFTFFKYFYDFIIFHFRNSPLTKSWIVDLWIRFSSVFRPASEKYKMNTIYAAELGHGLHIPVTDLWNLSLHNWKIWKQGGCDSSSAFRCTDSIIFWNWKHLPVCVYYTFLTYCHIFQWHLQLPFMRDFIPLRFIRHAAMLSIHSGPPLMHMYFA